MDRRGIIFSGAAMGFAVLMAKIPKDLVSKIGKSHPINVSIRTDLPRAMTLAEFRDDESKFVKIEEMEALVEGLQKQGKIRSLGPFEFNETYTNWQIQFDSFDSFQEWDNAVSKNALVNDPLVAELGYTLAVTVRFA